MENVLRKVGVVMRERAAHIVTLSAARFDEPLEIRHDPVIRAVPVFIDAEAVIDLFPAIQRQNNVVTFPVRPLNDFISQIYAVGRQRKAEILVFLLLDTPCIRDQLFAHLKVHKRLAAEEINLEILPETGVFHQKVERPFPGLKVHQALLPVKLAL